MKKINAIFLLSTAMLLPLEGLKANGYGSRMNLPEGSMVTADFIDTDGDKIDDRYQNRPTRSPIHTLRVLPYVEYVGVTKRADVRDLRFSIQTHQDYVNLKAGLDSNLRASKKIITKENLEKFKTQDFKGIIFKFLDAIAIIKVYNQKEDTGNFDLIISDNGKYAYYEPKLQKR